MADTTDTPTTPPKPATARRRAPRKPAATKTATPKRAPAAKADAAPPPVVAPKRAATPKPRSTKRATPAPKPRATPAPSATKEKTGGRWGKAAIAGGLATVGAVATAALLSLRSSTPKDAKPKRAHTPDGTDASKSFAAGIADENVIPEKK